MGEWLRNPKLLDECWLKEFWMTYRQFCKLVDMLILLIKKTIYKYESCNSY